jgi:hypothetical protein
MPKDKPPFRADVVGSLLRPAALKEARASGTRARSPRPPQGGRGPRDREDHQKATGRGGAARSRPTANSAARGGISISSTCSTASRSPSSTTASSFTACRPSTRSPASSASSAFPATRCWSISSSSRRTPASRRKCASRARRSCISAWSRMRSNQVLRRPRRHLRRSGQNLPAGDPRFYDAGCRYLQFDDTAWAYLCSKAELTKRASAAQRRAAGKRLCPRHQRRARRQAGRHGGHDACLPRQFPLDLDFRGRLRAGRRDHAR